LPNELLLQLNQGEGGNFITHGEMKHE